MLDESRYRELARAALKEGRLPKRQPDRMWGGRGTAAECVICSQTIGNDENELEIAFDQRPGMERHYIHPHCFAAWEFERMK